MIDAEKLHRPERAPALIEKAIQKTSEKSLHALARKVGVSPQHLGRLRSGKFKNMSYPLQVTLECFIQGSLFKSD
jgi:ABC-type methionine transport system ATPase subunit